MASGDDAVKVIDAADLVDDGPMVRVESVEKTSIFSYLTGGRGLWKKQEAEEGKTECGEAASLSSEKTEHEGSHHGSSHSKEHIHDGEGIKSSYDVEEDTPPSLLEQFKTKVHWNRK